MSLSLEQRISSALGGGAITSSDLEDLIAETDKAAAAAAAESDAERAKALDIEQEVDLATVHAAMERASIAAQRLRAAMPRLWAKFDQITAKEHAEKWHAECDEVSIVRDNLAAELNEVYAPYVERLADLLTRIAACDEEITRIGVNAPSGEPRRLAKVELAARNIATFSRSAPPITDELRLPPWSPGAPEWPPQRPFSATMAAAITPRPFDRRFSPDWWMVKEEEEARLREQQKLEAEQRAAEASANWRGPKWWDGERA